MHPTRREFNLALASLSVPSLTRFDAAARPAAAIGGEKIAFLLYPGFTALDVVGPHYMLASLMGAKVWLVAERVGPVESDLELAISATSTFDDCPADLDILCVPGGTRGTVDAMQHAKTIAFLVDRGARAKYVTSVCTGSMLLGAAGLLKGYRATSHWATREILKEFGAEPVDARVVIDRNRITGAGVTAGIDFGLEIVARQRDESYAKSMQLLAEYAPAPRFDAGTPAAAGPELTARLRGMLADAVAQFRKAAQTSR